MCEHDLKFISRGPGLHFSFWVNHYLNENYKKTESIIFISTKTETSLEFLKLIFRRPVSSKPVKCEVKRSVPNSQ